jgi:hypothetical protein
MSISLRYNGILSTVDSYLRKNLSLEHLLTMSDHLKRLKMYTLADKNELYLFDHMGKINNRVLENEPYIAEKFEPLKYKTLYHKLRDNLSLMSLFKGGM